MQNLTGNWSELQQVEDELSQKFTELANECKNRSTYCSRWAHLYALCNSMSTFLVVVGGLFMAAVVQMADPETSKPVVTAMSISMSIIKSLQQVWKWNDKGITYKKSGMKYLATYRSVDKFQMRIRISDMSPTKLLEELSRYNNIVDDIEMDLFKYNISSDSDASKLFNKSTTGVLRSPITGGQILKAGLTPTNKDMPSSPLLKKLLPQIFAKSDGTPVEQNGDEVKTDSVVDRPAGTPGSNTTPRATARLVIGDDHPTFPDPTPLSIRIQPADASAGVSGYTHWENTPVRVNGTEWNLSNPPRRSV